MLKWMKNYQNVTTSEVKPGKEISEVTLPFSSYSPLPPTILEFPPEAIHALDLAEELDFDCFVFARKFGEKSLLYLMEHLFTKNEFFSELGINQNIFENFINKISNG